MGVTVGVLSDTHNKVLPQVHEVFADCGLLLHCGDFCTMDVVAELETLATIQGVSGNMDGYEMKTRFPEARIVDLAGTKILLVHGHHYGPPAGRSSRLARSARTNGASIVIHGHSHEPVDESVDGVRVLNPGSASQPRREPHPTVGLLHLDNGQIRWELVELK